MTDRWITPREAAPLSQVEAMWLAGIGALVARGEVWRLTYPACGHVQDLPRTSLDVEQVVAQIQRDYARCLVCARPERYARARRAAPRTGRRPGGGPAERGRA
jgi:hypothetical protein